MNCFILALGCLLWAPWKASGQSEGSLRLVGSFGFTGGSSGRLEIYYNSQWGTVCDDSFGLTDANVACRQLGYTGASRYGNIGSLGFSQASSSTQIWLDEVVCFGTESRLASCRHNGYGNHNCVHSEDVALVCSSTGGTSCSSLSSPFNGRVSVSSRLVGGTATYSCNSGYTLSGSSTRTCQFGGSWSGSAPTCLFQFSGTVTTFSVAGVAIGVVVGSIVFIIVVVVCIVCCVACIAKSSSSRTRTVQVARPSTTANVVTYTTTQANTAYPVNTSYSAAPQQPPAAYPIQPEPTKDPINPEFSSGAPPAYSNISNYPAQVNPYPPPANTGADTIYPSTDPTFAGYPPTDPTAAGYPPTDPTVAGYPPTDPTAAGYPSTDATSAGYPPINPTGPGYPPTDATGAGYPPTDPYGAGYHPTEQ